MKKITLVLVLVFQLANATEKDSLQFKNPFTQFYHFLDDDCDACGCSASGGSMGFASMLNSNFVGIRYFNQQYKSSDGLYSNSPWYEENFNTIQIWARVPVSDNIQVSALMPYHFHDKETSTGNKNMVGSHKKLVIKDNEYYIHGSFNFLFFISL